MKDLIQISGRANGLGITSGDNTAPADLTAPIISSLLRQGASLRGITHCDELGLHSYGKGAADISIVNPKHPGASTLGSSGGAAASVAAGDCDFAIATDSGGSTRLPAAACSVTALKLSRKTIPPEGIVAVSPSLDSYGLIASTVGELERIYSAMSPSSEEAALTPPRIVVPLVSDLNNLTSASRGAFEDYCESICRTFELVEKALPFADCLDLRKQIVAYEAHRFVTHQRIVFDTLRPASQAVILYGSKLSEATYHSALEQAATLSTQKFPAGDVKQLFLYPAISMGAQVNFFSALANICDLSSVVFQPKIAPSISVEIAGHSGEESQMLAIAGSV